MVDSALRSSRRMSRLVADLLLLARADAGRLDKHRRCDLAEVAGDAAAEAAPLMGDRLLEIDNERPLRVEGSPDELHRMVLNLLDNAARHTPDRRRRSSCGSREEGGEAVVEVADDGPGIPVAMREQIFDRFVRGEGPADTAGGTGTGLGLAIVSAVAKSHGGSVEAGESAQRRRPLPRPDPDGRAGSRPAPRPSRKSFKRPLGTRPRFPRGRDTLARRDSPQTLSRRAFSLRVFEGRRGIGVAARGRRASSP